MQASQNLARKLLELMLEMATLITRLELKLYPFSVKVSELKASPSPSTLVKYATTAYLMTAVVPQKP